TTSFLGRNSNRRADWLRVDMSHTRGLILVVWRKRTLDTILVTGGAGFIGSNFILSWMGSKGTQVINLDLLTYAGNPAHLSSPNRNPRYLLARGDICDAEFVGSLLREHQPRAIVHFAAESHVDRSIV